MGRMAAEHVLLSMDDVEFKRHTTIPFEVAVRDSTAAPAKT